MSVVEAVKEFCPPKVVDGHDEGQVGGSFLVEAKGQSSICGVPCRFFLPFCHSDAGGEACQLNR